MIYTLHTSRKKKEHTQTFNNSVKTKIIQYFIILYFISHIILYLIRYYYIIIMIHNKFLQFIQLRKLRRQSHINLTIPYI